MRMHRIAFVIFMFVATVGAGPATRPADYAAFRDGGGLSGVAPPLPHSNTPHPAPFKLRWTYQTGEAGEASSIAAAAAISEKTVYVADGRGTLHAVDIATGKKKWTYSCEGGFAVTPLIFDGHVYVGDLAGTFHCVSAATGKKVWTYDTDNGIHASAEVSFEKDGPHIMFGNDGGQILCMNPAGKKIWQAEAGDRVNAGPSLFTVKGQAIALFSGCDNHLRAIKVADGKDFFDTDMGNLAGGSPVVAGNHIYVGTDQGHVLCYSLEGKIVWDFDKIADGAMVYASPAVADGLVVAGARDRKIYALDAKDGKPRWTFPTRDEVDSSALISGDRVFVASKDKKLYAIDLKNGKQLWSFPANRGIEASPCIAEGVIVIGDSRGALYCLSAP